ncbi:MAG: MopE-related protein, partial [Myxococcota bacterium]|nr:MopE-related protein [Myxococcota bacterium]
SLGATSNDADCDGVLTAEDCDDGNDGIYPGAPEECGETVDRNCDGSVADEDADGDGAIACEDCDDSDPATHPGASETCDGWDNDCDGDIDENLIKTWYADMDQDLWGDAENSTDSCDPPDMYSQVPGDCDDNDPGVYPGANDCAHGASCLDVLELGLSTGDGPYTLDSDGYQSGVDAFEATCDMSTDGGGWTGITGALVQEQGWLTLAQVGGDGESDLAWVDEESFGLSPGGDTDCTAQAMRATAELAVSFSEWFGAWTAMGASTEGAHDDTVADVEWGEVGDACEGHLKFGTDSEDSKVGGEWGADWSAEGASQTWEWDSSKVETTTVLRWEVADEGAEEGVVISDIVVWVR